ncbi:TPA: Ig-like domain-containing protein [Staphylococcus aureus]|nr:Ig-like domain-containing protein [Staphylococcus aureus]
MSTILKIYKDNEVIAQQLVSLDNENDHNNDVYIKVQGLTPDTNYSEGALQAVWEIDNVESGRVNVPEFRTAYVPIESFTINQHEINLKVNDCTIINPEIRPYNATNQGVTYTTKNLEIAGVNGKGFLIAYSPGTTEIEVYANDLPDQKEICVVNVSE